MKESSSLVKKFVNCLSSRAHVSPYGSGTLLLRKRTGVNCSTLVVARATEITSERPTIVTKPAAEMNPIRVITNLRCYSNNEIGELQICFFQLLIAPECSEVTCPVSNKRFIERGCRPEYKGKACCPTRFVCRKSFYLVIFCFVLLNKTNNWLNS
jgi:hypothetical protein